MLTNPTIAFQSTNRKRGRLPSTTFFWLQPIRCCISNVLLALQTALLVIPLSAFQQCVPCTRTRRFRCDLDQHWHGEHSTSPIAALISVACADDLRVWAESCRHLEGEHCFTLCADSKHVFHRKLTDGFRMWTPAATTHRITPSKVRTKFASL